MLQDTRRLGDRMGETAIDRWHPVLMEMLA
jgi:hypothetical protein